jgi:hypothetical protein
MKLFLIASLISLVTSISKFTYKSCGTSTDIAQNINLNVDPILPQTDYTLYLSGDFSKEITSGTSKYSVVYNGLPISPTINNLCDELKNSNTSCPISQGFYSSQSKGTTPTGFSGKVSITNEWFDQSNERILCLLFTIAS